MEEEYERKNADRIIAALEDLELDQNPLRVWDANSLIAKGFPADVVLDATQVFKIEPGYVLRYEGNLVAEHIGAQLSV